MAPPVLRIKGVTAEGQRPAEETRAEKNTFENASCFNSIISIIHCNIVILIEKDKPIEVYDNI